MTDASTPEMYFNLKRIKYLTPEQSPSEQPKEYNLSQNVALNNFTIGGQWQFGNDYPN